jgi:hypothetical protein
MKGRNYLGGVCVSGMTVKLEQDRANVAAYSKLCFSFLHCESAQVEVTSYYNCDYHTS